MKSFKDCVATLKREGARSAKSSVYSVTFTDKGDYTQVNLVLTSNIEAYVADKDGVFKKGENNIISMPLGILRAVLRENDDFRGVIKPAVATQTMANLILADAEIEVLLEDVGADQEWKNIFASDDKEAKVLGHDTIIQHLIKVTIGAAGKKTLEQLRQRIVDAAIAAV